RAGSGDDPREHVTAELVGAEQVLAARSFQADGGVDGARVRRGQAGEDRAGGDGEQEKPGQRRQDRDPRHPEAGGARTVGGGRGVWHRGHRADSNRTRRRGSTSMQSRSTTRLTTTTSSAAHSVTT